MPKLDGLVPLMEVAPVDTSNETEKIHRAADGVNVQLHLTKETMLRLLSDPLLHKCSI